MLSFPSCFLKMLFSSLNLDQCGCVRAGVYSTDVGNQQPAIRAGQPQRIRYWVVFTGKTRHRVVMYSIPLTGFDPIPLFDIMIFYIYFCLFIFYINLPNLFIILLYLVC